MVPRSDLRLHRPKTLGCEHNDWSRRVAAASVARRRLSYNALRASECFHQEGGPFPLRLLCQTGILATCLLVTSN